MKHTGIYSDRCKVTGGIPQGSALGPMSVTSLYKSPVIIYYSLLMILLLYAVVIHMWRWLCESKISCDDKLQWSPHIDKANKSTSYCLYMIGSHHTSLTKSVSKMLIVIESLVLSHMRYTTSM